MDRLSDFKLGMGAIIKADKAWHSIGWPQVAMRSQLPRYLVVIVIMYGLPFILDSYFHSFISSFLILECRNSWNVVVKL